MDQEDPGLAPTVPPDPRPPEPNPHDPDLGGIHATLAAARRAPARTARLEALIRLGRRKDARAFETLQAAAREPDWIARKYALSGLGALGLPEALPLVLAGLADEHLEVRRTAHRALAALDATLAHGAAWRRAATDADYLIRATALAALEAYPDDAAIAPALHALADDAWIVRFRAVKVLEGRDDPRITPALIAGLATDAELAMTCGQALATRGELAPLLAHLPASPPWRYLAIAAALGRLDRPQAREALLAMVGHPDAEVDQAILAHGAAMVQPLTLVLADDAWGRRWHAARLLGGLGDRAATVPLLPLVEDAHPEVKLAAIGALAALADPAALVDLVACTRDPSWRVREQAMHALGRLDAPEALAALQAALADDRLEVREAAAAALASRQPPA